MNRMTADFIEAPSTPFSNDGAIVLKASEEQEHQRLLVSSRPGSTGTMPTRLQEEDASQSPTSAAAPATAGGSQQPTGCLQKPLQPSTPDRQFQSPMPAQPSLREIYDLPQCS
eukprot:764679-Hanusia_phi.AAC.2